MTLFRDLAARLVDHGMRPGDADERKLAYAAMVAITADGGSWPGLTVEVTDRAALLDALATAVEVRTLEAAFARGPHPTRKEHPMGNPATFDSRKAPKGLTTETVLVDALTVGDLFYVPGDANPEPWRVRALDRFPGGKINVLAAPGALLRAVPASPLGCGTGMCRP